MVLRAEISLADAELDCVDAASTEDDFFKAILGSIK